MTKSILLLEDDLITISAIANGLADLEMAMYPTDIALTVFATYKDVEELVNPNSSSKYDLILLDRDCKLAGSFHVLEIERFGAENIISISSNPEWNKAAQARGVETLILKTYEDMPAFIKILMGEVQNRLSNHK